MLFCCQGCNSPPVTVAVVSYIISQRLVVFQVLFNRKSKKIFSLCTHLNVVKLCNLLYRRRPLFLTEMYVCSAAHFRAMA